MDKNRWLEWAKELQNLSQCALAYCKDVYDIERFERIRVLSAEMLHDISDLPMEKVADIFCGDTGYQTPKLDCRAAVFRDGGILLVQERDGRWALPGGWVEYNLSVRENTIKEVREEAGMEVRPERVIALLNRNRHHAVPHLHEITSVYVLCEYLSGAFQPNTETVDCGFFPLSALPPLSEGKTTRALVEMCFRAAADPGWQTLLD